MAVANNMHNLTTLIKRLEAATSRLEDIATTTELPKDRAPALQQTFSPAPQSQTPTPPAAPAAPNPPVEDVPEAIEEFDAFLSQTVDKYVALSHQIGGLVAKQAAIVQKGFQEQRKFLLIASKSKKPNLQGAEMSVFQNLLKPTNEALVAVSEIKDANRPDPKHAHLCAVADGIMVLAWVTIEARPYKHVDETLGSAKFFGNRVLKEYKDKDQKQIDWLNSFYQIFSDLSEYVKQYHSSGVAWNPKGEPADVVAKSMALSPSSSVSSAPAPPAPAPPAGGAPPPPPPPPGPPPVLDIKTEPAPPAAPASGFGAVFSELNKGESVTKGLRKVEKSQMTHKNPSLRAGSTVDESPRAKSPAPVRKPKPESMRVKKPAKKELEGNKWTIENYEKEQQPIEIDASLTHSILISRCNSSTIIIKGKANQVTVENSTRLSLIVDTLVSTVDVIKANNFALQVLGTIPTVMLDQVDSAQIYFSKASTGTKVFTSKSAGVNLNVIGGGGGDDEDYKEVPLPSQICSYYDEEKDDLVNEIVAHAG